MKKYSNLLRNMCHVNTNNDNDRFVGFKVDSESASVFFPIGYQLPETENELRVDIIRLINILSEYNEKKDSFYKLVGLNSLKEVKFPINAYLEIINYYLEERAYYIEKEVVYKESDRGKTDWTRTIHKQKPIIQVNNSVIYLNKIVRFSSPNENKLITQIHKYCVFESFKKIGWLFTTDYPPRPEIQYNKNLFIDELNFKLRKTNNDRNKRLFNSMISMLNYYDNEVKMDYFHYGTFNFEYVWEMMIDKVFGVKNKDKYFPKAIWHLKNDKFRKFEALRPDTIMVFEDKIFVLDAKYYKYGITGNLSHLPEGKSIHKQITYGEFISTNKKFINDRSNKEVVFNAFLMPYNSKENVFKYKEIFENVGESTGEWKEQLNSFERVQAILVDIRYLMINYNANNIPRVMALANSIEAGLQANQWHIIDNYDHF